MESGSMANDETKTNSEPDLSKNITETISTTLQVQQPAITANSYRLSTSSYSRTVSIISCRYCKKIGHTIDICRKRQQRNVAHPPSICEYCNNLGHNEANCKTKRRQEPQSFKNDLPYAIKEEDLPPLECITKLDSKSSSLTPRLHISPTIQVNSYSFMVSPSTFLIDTGAQNSLIKKSIIASHVPINSKITCTLCTLSGNTHSETYQSLGQAVILILVDTAYIPQTFQVIPDDISLKHSGILGADFHKENKLN